MRLHEGSPTSALPVAHSVACREDRSILGTRPHRVDAFAKVTGEARFGADIHLPRLCVARCSAVPMLTPELSPSIPTSQRDNIDMSFLLPPNH